MPELPLLLLTLWGVSTAAFSVLLVLQMVLQEAVKRASTALRLRRPVRRADAAPRSGTHAAADMGGRHV